MSDTPSVTVDVQAQDVINSLIQQAAEKAGQLAMLEAKLIALSNVILGLEESDGPGTTD